jgi:hypothetical protein
MRYENSALRLEKERRSSWQPLEVVDRVLNAVSRSQLQFTVTITFTITSDCGKARYEYRTYLTLPYSTSNDASSSHRMQNLKPLTHQLMQNVQYLRVLYCIVPRGGFSKKIILLYTQYSKDRYNQPLPWPYQTQSEIFRN